MNIFAVRANEIINRCLQLRLTANTISNNIIRERSVRTIILLSSAFNVIELSYEVITENLSGNFADNSLILLFTCRQSSSVFTYFSGYTFIFMVFNPLIL